MTRTDLTRRELIVFGAAATAATAFASTESARASITDSSDVLAGTVRSIESERSASISATDLGEITVNLSHEAQVTRGDSGVVPDLTHFGSGDEVVVVGSWRESVLVTSHFQSLYHGVRGEVVRNDNGLLATSAGPLYLPAAVRARDGVGDLTPGEWFEALVWLDPRRPEPIAAALHRL